MFIVEWVEISSRVLKNPYNAASFDILLSRILGKVAPIARFPEEDFPGKSVSKGRADFFSSLLGDALRRATPAEHRWPVLLLRPVSGC